MAVYTPLGSTNDAQRKGSPSVLGPWTILICVVCTMINISILVYRPVSSSTPAKAFTYQSIQSLRRPSQFIGFDRIVDRPPFTPKHFINYPVLLTQVDKAQPDLVSGDDPRRYLSRIGTVSPEDRLVRVNQTVSTIAQFRAIDYGMEICEVQLYLTRGSNPPSASTISSSSLLFPRGVPFSISLFRLNTTSPNGPLLDPSILNHHTRPPRLEKIADIPIRANGEGIWSQRFACSIDEVLSFELACDNEEEVGACDAEWWQNHRGDRSGKDPSLVDMLTSDTEVEFLPKDSS